MIETTASVGSGTDPETGQPVVIIVMGRTRALLDPKAAADLADALNVEAAFVAALRDGTTPPPTKPGESDDPTP